MLVFGSAGKKNAFIKHRGQINGEVSRLNLGTAVRQNSSKTGFRKMCIDLSFSFMGVLSPINIWRGRFIIPPLQCLEYRKVGRCSWTASPLGFSGNKL
jgi:hypothetical protein